MNIGGILTVNDPLVFCWEELANTIVDVTATDYINSLNGYVIRDSNCGKAVRGKQITDDYRIERMISECKRFFKSQWYALLTDLDGDALQKKCEELAPYYKDKKKRYHLQE